MGAVLVAAAGAGRSNRRLCRRRLSVAQRSSRKKKQVSPSVKLSEKSLGPYLKNSLLILRVIGGFRKRAREHLAKTPSHHTRAGKQSTESTPPTESASQAPQEGAQVCPQPPPPCPSTLARFLSMIRTKDIEPNSEF